MAKTEMDRDKLRVHLRRLSKDALLDLLDRAIDVVPRSRLPALVKGHVRTEALRPDGPAKGRLLETVTRFRDASMHGEYYEDFMVHSIREGRSLGRQPGPEESARRRMTRRLDGTRFLPIREGLLRT